MVRGLKPFRRPNSVSTLSIYIVRKIHHSSQFNDVFRKMLSGHIYIYTFLDFMCSHERMYVYGRYSPEVYIYFFY